MKNYVFIENDTQKEKNEIIEIKVDILRNHPKEKGKYEIGGVVVCLSGNRDKRLIAKELESRHEKKIEYPVIWREPSPWMATKYTSIPDSDNSRFSIIVDAPFSGLSIVLISDDDECTVLGEVWLMESLTGIDNSLLDFIKKNIQLFKNEEKYATWRKILDGIPDSNRDEEWMMSSIMLNCIAQKDAKKTFKQVKTLKNRMNDRGDDQKFSLFWSELSKVLSPLTLNSHGYYRSLKNRNADILWAEIEKFLTILKSMGYDSIINSGTLLGYIRNGDFIGHDDDIDLAVMLKGNSPTDVVNEWGLLKDKLEKKGLLDVNKPFALHCKLNNDLLGIDLFPSWIIEKKLYIWPYSFAELDSSDFYPVKKVNIFDTTIFLPNNPENILSINYGNKWEVPDPTWSFDWSIAGKRFKQYLIR